MPFPLADQMSKVESYCERHRVQIVMHTAAIPNLAVQKVLKPSIKPRGETVIAGDAGAAGGLGGVFKNSAATPFRRSRRRQLRRVPTNEQTAGSADPVLGVRGSSLGIAADLTDGGLRYAC